MDSEPMPYTISMTEADLIQGCLEQNRLAQKTLYERYKNAMYTVAYRVTGDQDLAEDVLQDAFIKVFRHLAGFRQESTLGAWIKTIVVRTALSKIKKEQYTASLDQVPPDTSISWSHRLDAEYLEKAIMALPTGYRTVFVLIEVEGYGHQEVADLLGITVGTSKSQLFYAKKRLRETLGKPE